MAPLLLLALPAVASAIGLPIPLSPGPPEIAAGIQRVAARFASEAVSALAAADSIVLDLACVACFVCLLAGVLLYFTSLGRKTGGT